MKPAEPNRTATGRLSRALTHPALSCLLLLAGTLPLLLAGRYNHPANDDFTNTIWTDFWRFQRDLYCGFTGRVFSSVVLALNPIHWNSFDGYRFAAQGLILLFASTYPLAVSALLSLTTSLEARLRFLIGVITTLVLLNGLVSLAEAFYWYTGAMTYTLSVLLLCWSALAGLRMHRRASPGMLPAAGQAICLSLATACNEVIIPVMGALLVATWLHYRRGRRREHARWYLMLGLIVLAIALASLLAPGNFARQAGLRPELRQMIPAWLVFTKNLFFEWIREPVLLLGSVLYIGCFPQGSSPARPRILPALLLATGVIALVLLPAFWAQDRLPPYRVRNLAYMLFLPGWLHFLTALAAAAGSLARAYRFIVLSAAGMLALTQLGPARFVDTSNYRLLATGFREGILRNYDQEQRARYALIRHSASDSLRVPPLRYTKRNAVFFADLSPDPDRFPNPGAAVFWGKRRIAVGIDSLAP